MSVINETLDNLKQPKKRGSKALNPSSSAYCESSCADHSPLALKPYIISISFAVLMGIFFYISYSYFFASKKMADVTQEFSVAAKAKLTFAKPSIRPSNKDMPVNNPLAQNQYYQAMNLLNAGKEEQALESLRQIIKDHPDFAPAQKVYSMLTVH